MDLLVNVDVTIHALNRDDAHCSRHNAVLIS
jgi:hypothetical protein